jgi:hypothetical protein
MSVMCMLSMTTVMCMLSITTVMSMVSMMPLLKVMSFMSMKNEQKGFLEMSVMFAMQDFFDAKEGPNSVYFPYN